MNLSPFKGRMIRPSPPRQRRETCEIITKKGKDGSVRKAIRGNCTPQQLKALSDSGIDIQNDRE